MTNHPNRSKYAILRRRMASEGITIQAMKSAINKVLEENRTYGYSSLPYEEDSLRLFERLEGESEYGGGYMYSGVAVIVDGKALRLPLEFVNNHVIEEERIEYQADLLNAVRYSEEIEVFYRWEYESVQLWRRSGQTWELVEDYSQEEAVKEEEYGPCFFQGIREEVAKKLGVEVSSTFHAAFDIAADAEIQK